MACSVPQLRCCPDVLTRTRTTRIQRYAHRAAAARAPQPHAAATHPLVPACHVLMVWRIQYLQPGWLYALTTRRSRAEDAGNAFCRSGYLRRR